MSKRRAWLAPAMLPVALIAGCVGAGERPSMRSADGGRPVPPSPAYPPRSAARPSLPVRQPVPAVPIAPQPARAVVGATTAAASGLVAGPAIASLPLDPRQATAALDSFRASCPVLLRRTDASGLTQPADWQPACAAAASAEDAPGFFARWFEAVQVGDGRAYATGYYVPEIAASRDRRPGYDAPIYARPDDLVDVDLSQFSDTLKGRKVRGRVEGSRLVPYPDRAAIVGGAIDGHARVLGWAADPVELFFLQVQGSGVLRLADGGTLRIGYDTQNGRDYTGIGALMRDRGLVGPNQLSMQGIVRWLHDHPDQADGIMNANRSFVFFRPLDGDPVGALGVPVVGNVSAAADPHFVPLGAPVFLSMDRTDATALWVAQDTGGAIKGANRFDTFWGTGDVAASIAGGMSARGTAFLLLPVGTLARLGAVPAPPEEAGAFARP